MSATGSYFSRIFGNPRCLAARYSLTRNLRANLSPSRPRRLARPPPFVVSPRSSDRPRNAARRSPISTVRRTFSTAIAIFQSPSNTLGGASRPRKTRERVARERTSDGARACFASLTDRPCRKTGRSVSGRNPCERDAYRYAGSSHPGRPSAQTPRTSPLAPCPLPLAPISYPPIHIRRRTDVRHSHGDPLSRLRRPRLLFSPSWPYRALLHAPAFSLRNTGYPTFPFLGLVESSLASTLADRSSRIDVRASRVLASSPRSFPTSVSSVRRACQILRYLSTVVVVVVLSVRRLADARVAATPAELRIEDAS